MLSVIVSGNIPEEKKGIVQLIRESFNCFGVEAGEVEIDFVSPEEIRRLNNQYRAIDKATDVLSFPQVRLPESKKPLWGNIIISKEVVVEKGEELDDVIKHGILHLLGYDHEEKPSEWDEAARKINCGL